MAKTNPLTLVKTSAETAAFDAFISYSSKDKDRADQIVHALEKGGVKCWIAPRDIVPGREYGDAIITAIANCKIMVLVFSQHANDSQQVARELERAINRRLKIVPFRIENVEPTSSLEYYISTPHWLNAFTKPFEGHLDYLLQTVSLLLDHTVSIPKQVQAKKGLSFRKLFQKPAKIWIIGLLVTTVLAAALFINSSTGLKTSSNIDTVFFGKWIFEAPAAGLTIHQAISKDGTYSSKTIVEETGLISKRNSLVYLQAKAGSERLISWENRNDKSVKSSLIPVSVSQMISMSAAAINPAEAPTIAAEISSPVWSAKEADSAGHVNYEFSPKIKGQDWNMTFQTGPNAELNAGVNDNYVFHAELKDKGAFRAHEGKWTAVSQNMITQSGRYEVIDDNMISFTTEYGQFVWKRED